MGRLLRFLRTSGIFILGSMVSKLIGFVMLPLYTKWIAPDSFGYYDLSLAVLAIACEALFLNIWVVILRFMYDYDGGRKSVAFLTGMVIFSTSTAGYLLLATTFFLVAPQPYFWTIVCLGLIQNISMVWKFAARGYGKNTDFALSGVLGAILIAASNLLLVGYLEWGILGLYVSSIVAATSEILFLEIRVGIARKAWNQAGIRELRAQMKPMLRYALPIGISALCYWFIMSYSRVVVSQQLSLTDNGYFTVAARFGGVVTLLMTAMTFAWQELAFDKKNQTGAFFGKAAVFYFGGLVMLTSTMLPFLRIAFPYLVDGRYEAAASVIPSALFLAVMSGYSNFVVNILYGIKRSGFVLVSLFISGLANAILVPISVERFGLAGANYSGMAAFIINVIILQIFLRKTIRFRFRSILTVPPLLFAAVASWIYLSASIKINLLFGATSMLCLTAIAIVIWRKSQNTRTETS